MISKNRLKFYAALKQKKYRDKERRFLAEGVRLCEEALVSDFEIEELLYCPSQITTKRGQSLIEKYKRSQIPVAEIDPPSLKQISDTVHSQGILALVKRKTFEFNKLLEQNQKIVVALENVSEPGNLGTIMRTASWFGMQAILLSRNSVDYTNPKVVRASMGAVFHLQIWDELDLPKNLKRLKDSGYALFVADSNASADYRTAELKEKNVLIFGNETTGISEEIKQLADDSLLIPRKGKGESLNIAVAAGILLAEVSLRGTLN